MILPHLGTATVININEGKNEHLAKTCESLRGYSHFVAPVRSNHRSGMSLRESIDEAVAQCIDEDCLADYFRSRRAEVRDMFMTEYDEAEAHRFFMQDGWETGYEEGLEEGL